jgi:phosphocarrier protein
MAGRRIMYQRETTVRNETGLHARPASQFVKLAKKFESKIAITNLNSLKTGDAKSIVKVMVLSIKNGTPVRIDAQGQDEEEAVDALVDVIDSGFDGM